MRILMLNYEFPPLGGGAGNANYYLLREFSKYDDINIDLVTSSTLPKYEYEGFSENIKIYKLNVKKKHLNYWTKKELLIWALKAYKIIGHMVREIDYDLCHCWFGWPCGAIGYLFKKKVPYIISLRGSDVPFHNPRLKIIDSTLFSGMSRIVWADANRVIANSSDLKAEALLTLDRDIDIIPNGVDTGLFKMGEKRIKNGMNLLFVGRLNEIKGLNYLLAALSKIESDKIELWLVGDGPEKRNLEKITADLNIQDKVKFFGVIIEREELRRIYQSADVFVLPSLSEGMSNTILEAMACGLPIITTGTGGTRELIKNNGFIVPIKDPESIKNAIAQYLEDKKLKVQHGRKSREIAEGLSWEKVAKKYSEIYEMV